MPQTKDRDGCTHKEVCYPHPTLQHRVLIVLDVGLQELRRYFGLIVFQAYLQSTEPDTMKSFESFESFVRDRPGI
jgi:hypothetical protein